MNPQDVASLHSVAYPFAAATRPRFHALLYICDIGSCRLSEHPRRMVPSLTVNHCACDSIQNHKTVFLVLNNLTWNEKD